jgi:hypothetical protein
LYTIGGVWQMCDNENRTPFYLTIFFSILIVNKEPFAKTKNLILAINADDGIGKTALGFGNVNIGQQLMLSNLPQRVIQQNFSVILVRNTYICVVF